MRNIRLFQWLLSSKKALEYSNLIQLPVQAKNPNFYFLYLYINAFSVVFYLIGNLFFLISRVNGCITSDFEQPEALT